MSLEINKQEIDIESRINSFNEELKPLLEKYELGIGAVPQIINGAIVANPMLISTRKPIEPISE